MARDEPLIRIRLPEELKSRLEAAHEANGRSLTAEIRLRLEQSFRLDDEAESATRKRGGMKFMKAATKATDLDLHARVDDHHQRLGTLEVELTRLASLLRGGGK